MKIAFFSAALMAIATATHSHHHITEDLAQIDNQIEADALPPMRRELMLVRGKDGKPPTTVDVTQCKKHNNKRCLECNAGYVMDKDSKC